MLEPKCTNILVVSDQKISHLDTIFNSIDSDISAGMSYVRRSQNLTFNNLEKRFSGLNRGTLKRYMQQSYSSIRPLHIVAAYSWITMTPMTYFHYKQFYPEIDNKTIKALMCSGKLPSCQFNVILEMICNMLDEPFKQELMVLIKTIISQENIDDYDYYFPPDILDIDEFAIDYYRSVAITARNFREENNISVDAASRLIGLSKYQYTTMEDINKITPLPVSIGFRAKIGFKLQSHANFTSEMRQFPEFYKLRQVQNFRDLLMVEALKKLNEKQKNLVVQLLVDLSILYT